MLELLEAGNFADMLEILQVEEQKIMLLDHNQNIICFYV
jgi:hypothetical protein